MPQGFDILLSKQTIVVDRMPIFPEFPVCRPFADRVGSNSEKNCDFFNEQELVPFHD